MMPPSMALPGPSTKQREHHSLASPPPDRHLATSPSPSTRPTPTTPPTTNQPGIMAAKGNSYSHLSPDRRPPTWIDRNDWFPHSWVIAPSMHQLRGGAQSQDASPTTGQDEVASAPSKPRPGQWSPARTASGKPVSRRASPFLPFHPFSFMICTMLYFSVSFPWLPFQIDLQFCNGNLHIACPHHLDTSGRPLFLSY
jgi:hypothetical protein